MNGLYPIIRRKRRPLIEDDAPPVVAKLVEPVKAAEVVKPETEPREGGEGNSSDAKTAQST